MHKKSKDWPKTKTKKNLQIKQKSTHNASVYLLITCKAGAFLLPVFIDSLMRIDTKHLTRNSSTLFALLTPFRMHSNDSERMLLIAVFVSQEPQQYFNRSAQRQFSQPRYSNTPRTRRNNIEQHYGDTNTSTNNIYNSSHLATISLNMTLITTSVLSF